METNDGRADLLYGVRAIAEYLGWREKQARGRVDRGELPAFKIGGTICAKRSTLAAWIDRMEANNAECAILDGQLQHMGVADGQRL